MKVHLYTQFFNEKKIAPFFYDHYKNIVDDFFLFDDKSNDGSKELFESLENVNVEQFIHSNSNCYIRSVLSFNNNIWKRSRGKADWVILANIDEHIFHPKLRLFLKECLDKNVSVLKSKGYQMVSEDDPVDNILLCDQFKRGARFKQMDKCIIFNPNKIQEINFQTGRHGCFPSGDIVMNKNEIKLLHYKLIGIKNYFNRKQELKQKLDGKLTADHPHGWGHRYFLNYDETLKEFNHFLNESKILNL